MGINDGDKAHIARLLAAKEGKSNYHPAALKAQAEGKGTALPNGGFRGNKTYQGTKSTPESRSGHTSK